MIKLISENLGKDAAIQNLRGQVARKDQEIASLKQEKTEKEKKIATFEQEITRMRPQKICSTSQTPKAAPPNAQSTPKSLPSLSTAVNLYDVFYCENIWQSMVSNHPSRHC